jgi:organic anion transporter 4A
VSYIGGKKGINKLRFFALNLFVIGLGSTLFALPHFLSSPVARKEITPTMGASEGCIDDISKLANDNTLKSEDTTNYTPFFVIGNLLHGAGAVCFYPVGAIFLEIILPDRQSLIAFWISLFPVGAAFGFFIAGILLKIDTDFDRQSTVLADAEENENWFGAWWIGFAISVGLTWTLSAVFVVSSFWLTVPHQAEPVKEAESQDQPAVAAFKHLKLLPSSIWKLVTTPIFLLVIFFLATDGVIVSSLAAFLPKLLENQFQIIPSTAATVVGLQCVIGAMIGAQIGSWLIKRYKLKLSGLFKLYIISQTVAILFGFGKLAHYVKTDCKFTLRLSK